MGIFANPQILLSLFYSQHLMPVLISVGSSSYGPENRLWEIKHLVKDCYQDKTSWQGSWVTTKIVLEMALKKN